VQIQVTKEIDNKLLKVSELCGVDRNKIVEKAISYYLSVVEGDLDFKKELKSLDKLSDDSLLNFEEKL